MNDESRIKRKDKMMIAEGLRLDRKFGPAIEEFKELLNSALHPSERRWARAHMGAALQESFIPYENKAHVLDEAERYLRAALGVKEERGYDPLEDRTWQPKVHYAWAWARLGEVFRLKGSLPPYDVKQEGVLLRTNEIDYRRGGRCFEIAVTQRKDYSWALAHHGAMLINDRRFHKLEDRRCRPDAGELFETALKQRHYQYGWALFHLGAFHFLSFMDSVIESVAKNEEESPRQKKEREHTWKMAYSMVIALSDEGAAFYRHPMHPGSIGKDEDLTLTYDFLEYLPMLIRSPTTRWRPFWDAAKLTLNTGARFIKRDGQLAGSEVFRFGYVFAYVGYQAKQFKEALGRHNESSAREFQQFSDEMKNEISEIFIFTNATFSEAAKPESSFEGLLRFLRQRPVTAQPGGARLRRLDLVLLAARWYAMNQLDSGCPPTDDDKRIWRELEMENPVLKPGAIQFLYDRYKSDPYSYWWLLAPQWALDAPKRVLVATHVLNVRVDIQEGCEEESRHD